MKDLIKNDDAVSVVVGAILILAVLVTFMSVVTSSWVPIYESDAESAHSDDTHKAFMDIHKQIEMADEFARSATIDLGTEEMAFIQNSNSVGYLEVNESGGTMYVTTTITSPAPESDVGLGLSITGMDTNQTNPITNFSFEFNQLDPKGNAHKLSEDFMVQFRTSTLNRWISLYIDPTNPEYMIIYVKYDSNPDEKWIQTFWAKKGEGFPDLNYSSATGLIYINLLSHNNLNLTLIEPINQNVSLNGVPYNTNTSIASDTATLHDIIQHYMRLPGDGTGGDYYIDYVQFSGVFEGDQIFTYNTTQTFAQVTATSGETVISFDNDTKFGGGTLTLTSDYNFMVDQSYVYDSGAVFLTQEDGSVFKVNPPIVATNNSDGNLSLVLDSVVLKGDYQASGNDFETLYTTLVGDVYEVNGDTNRIMIEKDMKPEYYNFWKSYFEDIETIANSFTGISTTLTNNTAQTRLTLTIADDDPATKSIDVSIKTKVIIIS